MFRSRELSSSKVDAKRGMPPPACYFFQKDNIHRRYHPVPDRRSHLLRVIPSHVHAADLCEVADYRHIRALEQGRHFLKIRFWIQLHGTGMMRKRASTPAAFVGL